MEKALHGACWPRGIGHPSFSTGCHPGLPSIASLPALPERKAAAEAGPTTTPQPAAASPAAVPRSAVQVTCARLSGRAAQCIIVKGNNSTKLFRGV